MLNPQPSGIEATSPIVDLSSPQERQRLTPGALKAFFRIVSSWQLSAAVARALIGGMSNGKYQDLKRCIENNDAANTRPLSQDEMQRVSYVIGITKALRILHSQSLANRWMTIANSNPMFGGRSPITYVLEGGIPALMQIRRLLDARRGMNA